MKYQFAHFMATALYTEPVLPVYQCTKITGKLQGFIIYFISPT